MSRLKGVGGGGGGGGGRQRQNTSMLHLHGFECLNSKSMNWACMLATSLHAPFAKTSCFTTEHVHTHPAVYT